jgi:hypothetical protein
MIECREVPQTNILEIAVDGKVTREEFDAVVARMTDVIELHGEVRLLEVVRDIGGIEPSALWEDIKFGPKHMRDISHVAVVGDQKWLEWATALAKPFLSAEVRFFRLDQIDEARRWIADDGTNA